jgi:hypothetical protein
MPYRHAAMCCVVPFFLFSVAFVVHSAEETTRRDMDATKKKDPRRWAKSAMYYMVYYPWEPNCHRLTGENRRHEKKWRTKEKEREKERKKMNEGSMTYAECQIDPRSMS